MTHHTHLHPVPAQRHPSEPARVLDAANTSRDISEYLAGDHARVDAAIPGILDAIDSAAFEAGRTCFGAFRSALDRHIQIEEDQLFPAFEAATGTTGSGPAFVMRGEHVEIRRLLNDIERGLRECDAAAAQRSMRWLIAMLRLHNAREERVLYPMADRTLADDWKRAFLKRYDAL